MVIGHVCNFSSTISLRNKAAVRVTITPTQTSTVTLAVEASVDLAVAFKARRYRNTTSTIGTDCNSETGINSNSNTKNSLTTLRITMAVAEPMTVALVCTTDLAMEAVMVPAISL